MPSTSNRPRIQEPSGWPSLQHLQEQLERTLDSFYEHIGKHHHAVSGHVAAGYQPPADVAMAEAGTEITLEVPGMDAGDLEVEVGEGVLTIKGEKSAEHIEEGRTFLRRERAFGRFVRRFALPPDVDPDKTAARFENGVLTITIPGKPAAKVEVKKVKVGKK